MFRTREKLSRGRFHFSTDLSLLGQLQVDKTAINEAETIRTLEKKQFVLQPLWSRYSPLIDVVLAYDREDLYRRGRREGGG